MMHGYSKSRRLAFHLIGWLVLMVGIDGASGCSRRRGGPRVPVTVLGVSDRTSGASQTFGFDLQQARQWLDQALDDSRSFKLQKGSDPQAYQIELSITQAFERKSQRPEEPGTFRTVLVDLVLSRWDENQEQDKMLLRGKALLLQDQDGNNRPQGFQEALEKAIAQAVQAADLQIETRSLPNLELARMLQSRETEERMYALRALRERQAPELVDRLIELVSDPDQGVALEAVGVLVAQRDPRAVQPLIRATQGRDQIFLLQNITALGEIGGPVALGYLFTLAAGHTSPLVRERAQEALAQLEQQPASQPGSPRTAGFRKDEVVPKKH